jgi:hypothetical protein
MNYIRTTLIKVFISLLVLSFIGCDIQEKKERKLKSTYVKPYVTQSGKLVRGGVRKSWSSSPNRIKNQNRSKSYYNRNPNRRKLRKEMKSNSN